MSAHAEPIGSNHLLCFSFTVNFLKCWNSPWSSVECYLWWWRSLLWRFLCDFIHVMLCELFRDPVSIIASRCSGYFLILITHNHMLVVPKDAQTNHAHPSVYNCPGSCRFPGLNHLICHHTLRNQWPTRQQTAINTPSQMRLQPKGRWGT